MTSILSRPPARPLRLPDIPPLHNGDRLKQPEFHRRYEAMPEGVKAELIGGVVYMSSPVGDGHAEPHLDLAGVFAVYKAGTPGVRGGDNATVILGEESEPQPDLHLRLEPQCGGRVRRNAKGILVGPPELVIEVAHTSEAIDLNTKRNDYRLSGVPEYLVLCVREQELRAFDLKSGRERPVGADGVYRSKMFPGLWIDAGAVLSGDTAKLLAVLQLGIATPEHAAFVEKLRSRAGRAKPPGGSARKPRRRRNGGS
jgi:Uma2 family endonuclease